MFLHNVAVSHAKNITFTFTFTFTWRNRSCPAAGPAESRVGLEDAWYIVRLRPALLR